MLVCLPDLFYASVGDSLDQRYLSCTPPPELLMDDPADLPLVQLNHEPSKVGSEIISGNETKTREQQALSMVDRAGFGPATFRFLGRPVMQTGRSSAPSTGIPG